MNPATVQRALQVLIGIANISHTWLGCEVYGDGNSKRLRFYSRAGAVLAGALVRRGFAESFRGQHDQRNFVRITPAGVKELERLQVAGGAAQ